MSKIAPTTISIAGMTFLSLILVSGQGLAGPNDKGGGRDLTKGTERTTLERNMESAGKAHSERVEKESNRDKTHDGRAKVGKDTSVGGKMDGGTPIVDIKTTTK